MDDPLDWSHRQRWTGEPGVGSSTPVSPLVETPPPLVGDAMPQGLGKLVEPILAIAGDRGEVAHQPRPDGLEPRQAQGLVDRPDDFYGLHSRSSNPTSQSR